MRKCDIAEWCIIILETFEMRLWWRMEIISWTERERERGREGGREGERESGREGGRERGVY